MNMTTKHAIIKEKLSEWIKVKGDRKKRGEITKHICFVTGMHKKSVPRTFKRLECTVVGDTKKRGRHEYYGADVTAALHDVWEAASEICGELLYPVIGEYVDILIRDGLWKHADEATGKLHAMSKRTVRRRVKVFAPRVGRHGLSSTSPSTLKHIIPIFKGPWDTLPPGNGQLDTVVHCGASLQGNMAYSLNYTDSATYWTVLRAQWNKGQEATTNSMEAVRDRLPFPLLMVHPDTGSEFINHTLKRWSDEAGIKMTRSEPGKKNDNMHVEERNGHIVRDELGYTRLDVPEVIDAMNTFYDVLCLYRNHFIPVRRTLSKVRIGSKYKRTFEKAAKTPYQRVLEHDSVSHEVKEKLRTMHATLNPLLLKRELDILKKKIFTIQKNRRPRPTESNGLG